MAGFLTNIERRVIPRWRRFNDALKLKELAFIAPALPRETTPIADFLAQKIVDWRKHQTIGHATDFVGAAIALGKSQEAITAAKFLVKQNRNVSPWAIELAEYVLESPYKVAQTPSNPVAVEQSVLRAQVRSLRRALNIESRDPITWVELSRVYAILGHVKKAKHSMTVALQLAKNNRFVLRSASRLWVHAGDPEKAHEIIIRADRTRHDPWLLAAEIALGSIDGKRPKLVKAGRRMLSEGKFPHGHISELASALATLELQCGSVKKSKKLFALSLKNANENSFAQAAWVSSRPHSEIRLEYQYLTVPSAFEAEYRVCCQKGEWNRAVEQCKLWQFDQPFSSEPSVHGSFVAGVALEDYESSKNFAEHGLIANQADFTLWNNLAFACINLEDFKKAEHAISKADCLPLSDRDRAVLHATRGLLKFRTESVESGRQLYLDARLAAQRIKNTRLLTLATVFHAIEEITQEEFDSESVLSEAFHYLKRESDPIFRVLETKLKKMNTKLPKRP